MKRVGSALMLLLLIASSAASAREQTLKAARAAHPMAIAQRTRDGTPPPMPPAAVMRLVRYPAPAGEMSAYITTTPASARGLPAIIWISGGDSSTIGDFWSPASRSNDQTAAAFRKAGIVTMYPSARGGNDNPGVHEVFYGEIDDILAAADYLARQPQVDPKRIYLGGHSTGGTTALLVAEMTDRFRDVFVFGPVYDIRGYGDMLPVQIKDEMQARVRSPGYWLSSIRSPVFVFEGASGGNADDLRQMAKANRNPLVHFQVVTGATHFTILAPVSALVARKIVADDGETTAIDFTQKELDAAMRSKE